MALDKTLLAIAVTCASVWHCGNADAALVRIADGQAVHDTVRNVTWLANANLAATRTFGVSGINPNGSMSWDTAQRWIAAINAANYLGSNQWRLPATELPDTGCSQRPKSASFGYGCTGSEMGRLFYDELGGVRGSTLEQTHNASYGLFNNFQPYLYWSATLWTPVPNSAFSFSFGNGFQGTNVYANDMYAIPVSPGKIGAP
jgi:Protein of unknown function (DUF1566)